MKPTPRRGDVELRGFALVVTLTLMVLLSILAIGMLSLSTVALRTGGVGNARAEARASARMALMVAVGQLQKELGPDRAISARASLVHNNPSEPNLVGAWESWRWEPDSSSPNYSEKAARFKGWLVSTGDPAKSLDFNLPSAALTNPVTLIKAFNSGSNPNGPLLRAGIVTVGKGTKREGGYAYAVMDESLKASVNLPEVPSRGMYDDLAFRTAPPRDRPETIVSKLGPADIANPRLLVTLPTAVTATNVPRMDILGHENNLTVTSVSLLTDAARGGLKKDLTTAFETGENLTNIFGSEAVYNIADNGAPKWNYLRDHYQLYRRTTNVSGGVPNVVLTSSELSPQVQGTNRAPEKERLMPVISKMQIVFSAVTHYNHIGSRISYYNIYGNPKGNQNYSCPHLVYDPVVTLYNPYDVAIELPKLRVRVWDPPVLFGFKKNGAWLRPEFATKFQGLGQFQIANERNSSARKSFTMLLREKNGAIPGASIRMAPGEVKVFSPWVENSWTWGLETANEYDPRVFFDWNANSRFSNEDFRTKNKFGVETVPGWDPRAGLQTDHLSYASRPDNTRYDFEKQPPGMNAGWLAIKNDDFFYFAARPGRAVTDTSVPDFEVDLLAGLNENPQSDYLRAYTFRNPDIASYLSGSTAVKTIEREFPAGALLQKPADTNPGGKTPFAVLTMAAKTTIDPKDASMPWLHNHPVTEGASQNAADVGNALDTYDLRFEEIASFNTFPGVEIDPTGTNRGFYGPSVTASKGVSNVPMFRVPLLPAASLGDLIAGNLNASSALPRVTHALGNSRSHPLLPEDAAMKPAPGSIGGTFLDHSYLMNDALWDSTFFSTAATFSGGLAPSESRSSLLAKFFDGERGLLNTRFIPVRSASLGGGNQASALNSLSDAEFIRKVAAFMAVNGGFNINSDSAEAWGALLSSLRDKAVRGWNLSSHDSTEKTSFTRASLPLGGDAEKPGSPSIDVQGAVRWAGYRALTDSQIKTLSEEIVKQNRARAVVDKAPSLSLGEFVNRRIGGGLQTQAGIIATAIDNSGINNVFKNADSKTIGGSAGLAPGELNGLANGGAREGESALGGPSFLSQGDLLTPLAPVITARGDTFRIRAYGEARDTNGNVTSRVWCEAVLQRTPDYVDPVDSPETLPAALTSESNKTFGRRFIMTSFRWIDSEEI